MKIHEHRIKLLLTPNEFSQFFKYHSEGRLLGSMSDLETDFESYYEGVGEADLKSCFREVRFETSVSRMELAFDLVLVPKNDAPVLGRYSEMIYVIF